MRESLPLNELSVRKRLVQARVELHRSEMALYYQYATQPIRAVGSQVNRVMTHPMTRLTLIGGATFLFVSRLRKKSATKTSSPTEAAPNASFASRVIWPRLRTFLVRRLVSYGMGVLKLPRF